MEKFDSAYLAYLCVWFQNITYYYVKHFIPIYVGLKLITILWINIQKGLLSSSLLFSCRAKRLNRGASVPPQQGVKIPVWWYSPTPNNATLTKQSMMIFISCYWEGGKTQVSFTSISRNYMYSQKKTNNTVLWIFENLLYIVLTCTWTLSLTF